MSVHARSYTAIEALERGTRISPSGLFGEVTNSTVGVEGEPEGVVTQRNLELASLRTAPG